MQFNGIKVSNNSNDSRIHQEYLNFLKEIEKTDNDSFSYFKDMTYSQVINSEEFKQYLKENYDAFFDESIEEIDEELNEVEEAEEEPEISDNEDEINEEQEEDLFSIINGLEVKLSDKDSSILNKLFGLDDSENLNINTKQAQVLISKIIDDDKGVTKEKIEILQKYFKKLSDLNFNEDQIIANIMGLDGNISDFSEKDIKALAEFVANNTLPKAIEEGVELGITPDSGSETVSGGGTNAPASSEKNINNMSVDDLKNELEKAKENFDSVLKTEDSQLHAKKTTAETNLNTAQTQSDSLNEQINSNKTAIVYNNTLISQNESEIAALEAQLTSDEEIDTASIQAKIDELKAANEALEQENQALITQNESLTAEKNEQDSLIQTYTQELSQIEEEINTLATNNPKVAEAKSHLDKVQALYDKRLAEQEAAQKVDILDVNKNSLDLRSSSDLSNLPLTYELDGKTYHCPKFASYDTDGDGKDDFTINSWEEFQRYAKNAGICNVGKYGSMQCQNASAWYMEFVLGVADMSIIKEMKEETENSAYGNKDTAGYMTTTIGEEPGKNQRYLTQVKGDRNESYELIVNELKNGRPCVVSVPGSSSSHYILAMGISDDGDILVMDSYDCSIQKLGYANAKAYATGDKQRRNLAAYNSVMVFSNKHTLQYGNRSDYITNEQYWATCGGDVEYRNYLALCHVKEKQWVARRFPELMAKYENKG